jgi:hypothetical protein
MDEKELLERFARLERDRALSEQRLDSISEKIDALSKDIRELKGKSGQRWDMVANQVITAIIAFATAFILKGGL